jgi:hypothetical protein
VDKSVATVFEEWFKTLASMEFKDAGASIVSPFLMNTPDPGANVWATGYSYFSTPAGTIGVDPKDDPDLQGAITGIVRPGISDDVSARPGFDLVPASGYVTYVDTINGGPIQIYPDPAVTPFVFGSSVNPLDVNIQLVAGAKSAAPERGGDNPFTAVAGLTLNYNTVYVAPVPELDASSQLTGALAKNLRAYYEILSVHRFVSNEPATPSTFFGYHPLTPTNMSAFDDMNLDIGAYDFISDNIKPKKPLSPYYGL